MNNAMYRQDVLRSYGNATSRRLEAIRRRYDPTGFFSRRQGGFKLALDDSFA